MAGITLAQAETQLSAWLTASEKVATGQSYTIPGPAGRTVTRVDADLIQSQITFWDNQVKRLSRGGRRCRFGTPT